MFMVMPRSARRMALLIAVLAMLSLAAQFLYLAASRPAPWPHTAWEMARYFTILTHLLVIVSFALIARPRRGMMNGDWMAALSLSAIMAGVIYHLVLSDLISFDGLGWWADHGLHSVTPAVIALWWLLHAPKQALGYLDLPIFVLWPAIYAAYALARGAMDGVYPYPFVDLTRFSPAIVATNLVGLCLLFLLGGVVMIMIGRYADR